MKELRFKLKGRKAYLKDIKYSEEFKNLLSYSVPGARFAPSYNTRNEDGKRLWDGKTSMFKNNSVSVGLLIGAYKEIKDGGFKPRITKWKDRPQVALKNGFWEKSKKYDYQNQATQAILDSFSKGGGTVLSATGCLDGDTYIDIPRNLEKHPYGIKIKDLVGKKPWVYAYSEKEAKIVLAQASSVHKSGSKVPVYKIKFDVDKHKSRFGGRKVEPLDEIVATGSHLFLMREPSKRRNNYVATTYKAVSELKRGDRVMPLFRSFGQDSYSMLRLTNGESVYEHKYILEQLDRHEDRKIRKQKDWHGHHKNEYKFDNRIKNLEAMTQREHHSMHSKRRHAEGISGWQNSGKPHPRGMLGKSQPASYYRRRARTQEKQMLEKIARDPWRQEKVLLKLYDRQGMSCAQIAAKYGVGKWNIEAALRYHNIPTRSNNHRVKSVKFLGYRDVYDITVPETNNFVANGIVVHNSGKTKLAAQCFSHIIGKCLFIVDQIHLLYQSREEISVWLKEEVGIIGNGKWMPQRVTVATIQTLSGHKDKEHFKKWIKEPVAVTFVDELHKQMARRNFTVLSRVKSQAVIGLTATLQMKKKMVRWKVYSISGPVIFEFPLNEGIKAGVLTKAAVVQVNVPYEQNVKLLNKLQEKNKEWVEDFDDTEDQVTGYWHYKTIDPYVVNVVCNKNITHKVIPDLVRKALDARHATIILADRLDHISSIARNLRYWTPTVLRGSTSSDERKVAIRRFEKGKIHLIVASRIFTKGINIKRISLIIDAAELPNKDDAMQKLGRGVRLHEDKDGLSYIDLVTYPAMIKAGASRRNAFKRAKVPVKVIEWTNAKAVLSTARKLLR